MSSSRFPAIILLAATLAAGAPAAAAGPAPSAAVRTRTLAVIPFYAPEKMWQLYHPLVDYLLAETGEPWELKLYATHEESIAAACSGAVDVSLFGPVPLEKANRACGAAPFLVAVSKGGGTYYHSMMITADPAVTSVAGLRGKKVGFFKGSSAAHVMPLKMLHDAGLGPGSFEPVFLESQDRIMTALLERRIAGAGVKETLYRRFEKEGLRLLQTSEPLPNFAFVALPSQAASFRERFSAALLKLRPRESAADAERVKGWDDEVKNGFAAPGPGFLAAVLALGETTRAELHEYP